MSKGKKEESTPIETVSTEQVEIVEKEVPILTIATTTFNTDVVVHTPTTKEITFSYPKGYDGKKYFVEGEPYDIAIDAAELYIKQGVAKLVK